MNFSKETIIQVRRNVMFFDRVELFFYRRETIDGNSTFHRGKRLEFEKLTEEMELQESSPTINLNYETAQKLTDALWEAGFRPDAAKGSVGQVEAIKEHLNDLRKLVFKTK